jgi:hypothetical protein
VSFQELSRVLAEERVALEHLFFRLEELKLFALSGQPQWLAMATRELEDSFEVLERLEERRRLALAAACAEANLGAEKKLRDLIEIAPYPWNEVLASHREPLVGLLEKIRDTSLEARQVLAQRIEVARMALSALGSVPESSYSPSPSQHKKASMLVDDTI